MTPETSVRCTSLSARKTDHVRPAIDKETKVVTSPVFSASASTARHSGTGATSARMGCYVAGTMTALLVPPVAGPTDTTMGKIAILSPITLAASPRRMSLHSSVLAIALVLGSTW